MTFSLDKKPYLIDAVIGNSRFLASVLKTGRLVRFWWPNVDIPQHADAIRAGLRVGGAERTTWFDAAEDGWTHEAAYVPRTNIFAVGADSANCPVGVRSELYSVPDDDILVFDYRFTNKGDEPLSFSFLFYASVLTAESPYYHTTQFVPESDALVHFRRDYCFAFSGANVCMKYQAGYAWDAANAGNLNGDRIQMSPEGAMQWEFRDVAPGQTVRMTVLLAAGRRQPEALAALGTAKLIGADELRSRTAEYWQQYLDSVPACPLDRPDLEALYERSLLTMKLMTDEETGSIIAAPEFDERFSRCGGYAYCWGRDAAFITTALDKAGLLAMSTRFYEWTLTAQDADGSWQQRHYHDGTLAPSWGLQIDEGSSILWGMNQHYQALPEAERGAFLESVWTAVRKGAEFLVRSIDGTNGLPLPSHDLWEERNGQHTYSSAAVYAGLKAAASLAELKGEAALGGEWNAVADRIADTITTLCWNEERGAYYRGVNLAVEGWRAEQAELEGMAVSRLVDDKGYERCRVAYDPIVDVSLLGISVPFAVVAPDHPQAVRTADAVERALTVPGVGGIKRYENDGYIGGNPWLLTTLWLAQYRATNGQLDEAMKHLDWAASHQSLCGLLPEQVDRDSGDTAWVVPLTWSHAMFILAVHLIAEARSKSGSPAAESGSLAG
ncbi:glycoside hydrolase family 15 protein [Cohnella fermenti]|uniref:Glycoside hydrolase family 15 n=1 Tax=Cohnella fermenti TaxID=2565925 RepID=A0A4S4BZY5_9BACL|nr:glycoside hydrolase family 15 protein [Cohnella fermenti]THF78790.1 glycoside hydrolase family 15 [Cohnella fermenti]